MNLLILDFLSIKTLSVESLLDLFEKHKQASWFSSKQFPGRYFILDADNPPEIINVDYQDKLDIAWPESEKFATFLEYLGALQDEWKTRVIQTIEQGPDIDFLNEAYRVTQIEFIKGETPWRTRAVPQSTNQFVFEDILLFDYLFLFLADLGEWFKKIRACKNPDCARWFMYKRPKQLYCCDKCRLDFHNRERIKSGDHAAYQRKMRRINPASYK